MSKGRGQFLQENLKAIEAMTSRTLTSGIPQMIGRGKLLEDLRQSTSRMTISKDTTVGRGELKTLGDQVHTSIATCKFHGSEEKSENVCNKESKQSSDPTPTISKDTTVGRGELKTLGDQVHTSIATCKFHGSEEKTENVCNKESKQSSDPTPSFQSFKTIHGKEGKPISLACNYIRLKTDSNKGIYEYAVCFVPNIDSPSMRMKYLNEHSDKFGSARMYDGTTLYLPILLENKQTTYITKSTYDDSVIQIHISFKQKQDPKNCIKLYNILFNRIMKTLNYVRLDRKQYDPTCPKIIPQHKLEIWPGYVTTVSECEGGLLLNCDVSHRLLHQKTVLEVLVEIHNSKPRNFIDTAKRALLGYTIITRYNNKHYRLDDISFDKNPQSTFQTENGLISFVDYFRRDYGIEINDKRQPLLISMQKRRRNDSLKSEDVIICLIPELSYLTGLRADMRNDHRLMRDIASFTRVTPNQRLQALEKFYTNVNKSEKAKQILNDWGLTLAQNYEKVEGRLFPEEKVYFAEKSYTVGSTTDFFKYTTTNDCLEVIPIVNWLLIYCEIDVEASKTFCNTLLKCTHAFGMKIDKPKMINLTCDRIQSLTNALRQNITKETEIVVCILSTNRDDKYNAIKKICCSEIPVPSQVINARTLHNVTKVRPIVQRIALQMNCKVGGSLWGIQIPLKKTIICGIDIYHERNNQANSVMAFVASLNKNFTKWFSKVLIQNKGDEIANGLCACFIGALEAYYTENKDYPENVIIYRDGITDTLLPVCVNYEIPQLEKASRMKLGCVIKITYIVVQKRIYARFFKGDLQHTENPCAGTVIDNTITRSNLYDFFVVSQNIRHGTSYPTHCIVLRDDSCFKPDILQRLTYKLCFLYYNWPGSIRVPACCQYAHKMAYLVGQNIKRPTADELATKLFYL